MSEPTLRANRMRTSFGPADRKLKTERVDAAAAEPSDAQAGGLTRNVLWGCGVTILGYFLGQVAIREAEHPDRHRARLADPGVCRMDTRSTPRARNGVDSTEAVTGEPLIAGGE
jgi:hypothetical protein